jgi:hypothetical protein
MLCFTSFVKILCNFGTSGKDKRQKYKDKSLKHSGELILSGAVEKVLFNRRVRKVGAKDAKSKYYNSALCDLCVKTLRPLRLMDFNFFYTHI